MSFDNHKNFAYSTVATAPSPATSGTSLVVAAGDGAKFPTTPFNVVIWPANSQPTVANAEIVRVTAIASDTFTITRAQEQTLARSVVVGDQIANNITVKGLTDIEAGVSPYSVKKYGAKGDGLTDDTVAIQNAINSAQTKGGGTVYFPQGTYLISATLTVTADNIQLQGVGWSSIIKAANSLNASMVQASAASGIRWGFGMKNLYLDGNQNNQTSGNGVELVGCYGSLLESVWVRYVYGKGLWLRGNTGQPYSAYNTFLNCLFTDSAKAGSAGIYCDTSSEFNKFIGCNTDFHTGDQGAGIYINSGNNVFIGGQSDNNGYNLNIGGNVHNKFIGYSFDRALYREVYLTGGTRDNVFVNCQFGYYVTAPLLLGSLSGTVTSIPLQSALPQAIPTWGVSVVVSYGTANAETFTVTSAGAAAGTTAIPVTSQTATKPHANGDYVVLRYRAVDIGGSSGPNFFTNCIWQGAESLPNNINWGNQVGEDAGCSSVYSGNIFNGGNGVALQPLSVFDYTNILGTALVTGGNVVALGNGGTGTATQFTQGSVVFAGTAGVYAQRNNGFFWDDTNYLLGIGTALPVNQLHLKGNLKVALAGTVAVTNGSPTVTGTGTAFSTALAAGDAVSIGGGTYVVLSIVSNTSLTLTTNYTGTTASGLTVYADQKFLAIDNGASVNKFSFERNAGSNPGLSTTNTKAVFEGHVQSLTGDVIIGNNRYFYINNTSVGKGYVAFKCGTDGTFIVDQGGGNSLRFKMGGNTGGTYWDAADSSFQSMLKVTDKGDAFAKKSFRAGSAALAQTTLQSDGGFALGLINKTAAYTMAATDGIVTADATTAAFTVTLPSANVLGQLVVIIKKDASVNAVTVSRAGTDTINGGTTASLASQYSSITLVSNGSGAWYKLAST